MNKTVVTNHKTKDGRDYIIRDIKHEDAMPLIEYARLHAFDPLYSVITSEEFTQNKEGEEKWIEDLQSKPGNLGIVAEMDGAIIGMLDFHQKTINRMKHFGTFGMSVHSSYRDQGVGHILLKSLVDWGRSNPEIDKISLSVLSTNPRGIHLYEKNGFVVEGVEKGFLKNHDGKYMDSIIMALWVN